MDFRTSQVGEVSNRDRQDAGGIRTHGECRFGSGCDQGGESLEPTIEQAMHSDLFSPLGSNGDRVQVCTLPLGWSRRVERDPGRKSKTAVDDPV